MKPYALSLILWGVILLLFTVGDAVHIHRTPVLFRQLLYLTIALGQLWSVFWGIIGFFSRKPKRDYLLTFLLGLLSLPTLLILILLLGGCC